MPTTKLLSPNPAGLLEAAQILRKGGLVAIPTETVYGLAADARNDAAVAAIYAAKGRPGFNPLIVHVCSIEDARRIARFDSQAKALAATFWPGALTLVLPLADGHGLSPRVTAGLPTVALRMPAHPIARALLVECGLPLAAPSANPSGRISPTTAAHVLGGLAGRIDAILDGGACPVGVESTILAPGTPPRLLRPGGITAEAIAACLGQEPLSDTTPEQVQAPGQMASHYAPIARLRLNVIRPRPDEIWIGFGTCPGAAMSLSETGDLAEAAARLFSTLRDADTAAGATGAIAVAPVPTCGLGRAINDRLARAAAPRPATP